MTKEHALWIESVNGGAGVRIVGSPESIERTAKTLRESPGGQLNIALLQAPDPTHGLLLKEMRIESTGEREDVVLSVEGETLVIKAGERGIRWLASTMERFARGEITGGAEHVHLEYFPDHPYLQAESTPAVLELLSGEE